MKNIYKQPITSTNSYDIINVKYTKELDFIPAVNNVVFLSMINNEKRKKYASLIIAEVLNKDYDFVFNNLKLLNVKLDQHKINCPITTSDFIGSIEDEIVIIEMNGQGKVNRLLRNIEYLCKAFSNYRKSGDDYEYSKLRLININNFSFKTEEDTITKYGIKDTVKEEVILTDYIYIYQIDLCKIRKKMYTNSKLNRLEKFMLVMNEEESKRLEEIIGGDKIMEEYREDVKDACCEELFITEAEQEAIEERYRLNERNDALKAGIKKGMRSGMKSGRNSEKKKIVKNMLKENVDVSFISKVTGLSKQQIASFK